MVNFILQLWICSAVILVSTHLAVALVIDRKIDLGLWTRGALLVFALLGPIGMILEAGLLVQVLNDLRRQSLSERRAALSRPARKRLQNQRYAGLHG